MNDEHINETKSDNKSLSPSQSHPTHTYNIFFVQPFFYANISTWLSFSIFCTYALVSVLYFVIKTNIEKALGLLKQTFIDRLFSVNEA